MIVRGCGHREVAAALHLRHVTSHRPCDGTSTARYRRTLRRSDGAAQGHRAPGPTVRGASVLLLGGRRRATPAWWRHDDVVEQACGVCGRRLVGDEREQPDPDRPRLCRPGCRGVGLRPVDGALETAILALLTARAPAATICPSEAARRVDPQGWRELLEPTRMAARRLVADGEVQIVQGGRVVDPSTAKGPIRIRRTR
jgi:Protein of unknown function (DUF3253)